MKRTIALILAAICFTLFANAQNNVGIGSTQPLYPLHIAAASGNNLLIENPATLANGTISSFLFASNVNSGTYKYTGAIKSIGMSATSARMGFYTYASPLPGGLLERMSIVDNGSVGIGITNPLYRLDVNGSARISGDLTASADINIMGDLTVQDGKGLIRSVNGTQLKYYCREVNFAFTLYAYEAYETTVNFTNGIFNSAPRVMVGDVVGNSGTGDFHKARFVVYNTTATGCSLRIYNDSNTTSTFGGTWSFICIGN